MNQTTSNNERPTFQVSVDTQMIYDRLAKAEVGERITYAELTRLIGNDVQDGGRSNLESARSKLMRDDRLVFGVIFNEGVVRLNDEEIVDTARVGYSRIRSAARRNARRATCVDFESLPNEKKIEQNAALSLFGTICGILRPARIKLLEGKVAETNTKLAMRPFLTFMAGKKEE